MKVWAKSSLENLARKCHFCPFLRSLAIGSRRTRASWRHEHDLEWSPSDGEGRECVTASDLDRLRIRLARSSLGMRTWKRGGLNTKNYLQNKTIPYRRACSVIHFAIVPLWITTNRPRIGVAVFHCVIKKVRLVQMTKNNFFFLTQTFHYHWCHKLKVCSIHFNKE